MVIKRIINKNLKLFEVIYKILKLIKVIQIRNSNNIFSIMSDIRNFAFFSKNEFLFELCSFIIVLA
jgi:hypothetical protein